MALILYTWGNKMLKKQFTGIKPCPQCGKITEQYIKRRFFTMGIFYAPLIWIPLKRYYVCESCGAGTELDKAKYKELMAQYKNMPKKNKVLTAFKELEAIAPTLPETERNSASVYEKITGNVKFTDEEKPFVTDMIDSYFGYAAAIAAKAAAEAEAARILAENSEKAADAVPAAGDTVQNGTEAAARSVPAAAENPLSAVPEPVQQPVRKKKWGWLVAGVLQTFIALFGLLMLFVGFGDSLFSDGIGFTIFAIALFGIIPIGLTVLFYYLYAKK